MKLLHNAKYPLHAHKTSEHFDKQFFLLCREQDLLSSSVTACQIA